MDDSPAYRATPAPARKAGHRYAMLATLALLPGFAAFGFRAAGVVIGVLLVYGFAARWLRRRGTACSPGTETSWTDALLLCGLLPAELAGGTIFGGALGWLWPVIVIAPLLLALLRLLRASLPRVPFDAVVVCVLLLHLSLGSALAPRAVLEPKRLFRGDVLHSEADATGAEPLPWYARPRSESGNARETPWAAEQLDRYIGGALRGRNLDSLMRDALPPMEDLVLLGHPTPIGMASGIGLLALVLWGAFHRTIDWRIPLVAIAACYVTLIVLPLPAAVSADGSIRWRLVAAWRADIGPATALTFLHYLLFASPTLFTLGLLAPRGDAKPVQPHAILPWSFVLGVATAVSTLYLSVAFGPLLAIAAAPAAARAADRLFARRPMRLPI